MKDEKTRNYFRLAYPESYRPFLVMDILDYEVEDVSEYGLKVKVDDDPIFMVGDSISMATIIFPGGREFDLSAHVVRVDHGYAGLKLDAPLPENLLRSEALYLMDNFPASQYWMG